MNRMTQLLLGVAIGLALFIALWEITWLAADWFVDHRWELLMCSLGLLGLGCWIAERRLAREAVERARARLWKGTL